MTALSPLLGQVDHLVYTAPELDAAVSELEARLGVRASAGGKHTGRGTHNALLALGGSAYLEIIAPDPEQPAPAGPRPFGLDKPGRSRLATWAAKAPDIEARVAAARRAGHDPGDVMMMGRELPDGTRLDWRLTTSRESGDGLAPFLIDWGDARHPAATAPVGCTLVAFRGEHPQPAAVTPLLAALAIELELTEGSAAALIATIDTPHGRVELR